jgi:serine/threonine protein kinase
LEAGFHLDGDLTVVDHLGGSRKVDVYLCRSRRLKGLVACKVLRPEYCIDFSALEDILHEGQILQRLRHPHVIEGYGVELEDHPRIVMQHLTGQTLSAAFLQGNYSAFNIRDAIWVTVQIADALTYIHARACSTWT